MFFTKSAKLEKGNLNVFAHISGLRLDTKMYCTSFETWKPKNYSIFYAFFAKNHHESRYGPKRLYHFFRDSLYLIHSQRHFFLQNEHLFLAFGIQIANLALLGYDWKHLYSYLKFLNTNFLNLQSVKLHHFPA